ncbi:HD domain-containing protein [bacterium]|nr:HD domain-containing protein [bacterium]
MDTCKAPITRLLIDTFGEDHRRIHHALDVLKHAERIAETAGNCDAEVLIASALLHDIGFKQSEAELGCNDGHTREKVGPPVAEKPLAGIGFPPKKTKKVCEIIGSHHSPSRYDYAEPAVLMQADAAVNRNEGGRPAGRERRILCPAHARGKQTPEEPS